MRWAWPALGVLLLLGVAGVPGTSAAFTDRATVTGAGLTSGSMTAPAVPTVTQTRGTGATRVAWSASAVGDRGGAPTAYEVQRYGSSTGGTPSLVCVVTTGTGGALACEDTSRPVGTRHYAVRARFGGDWRAESGRRAFAADVTGPTVSVTGPADGYRGNAPGLRRETTRACGTETPACGTTTDSAGIETVRWTLELVPSTGNRALRCWSGTAFTVAPGGGCAERDAVTSPVTGGVAWRVPGTADAAYRDRGTYTVTVVATDAFGSTTTVSATVTLT